MTKIEKGSKGDKKEEKYSLMAVLKIIDLNFLMQLRENDIETLVACIRDRMMPVIGFIPD